MRIIKSSFLPVLAAAALFAGTGAVAAERKATLVVKNMSCVTCAPTVKRALTGVKGVKAASISKIANGVGIATVIYDDARATPAQLASASTKAGYPATVRTKR